MVTWDFRVPQTKAFYSTAMQNTQILYHPNAHQTTLRHFGQMQTGTPPDGILPMHNHPKTTLPQDAQKKWNRLASVGVGTTILGALLLISSNVKAAQRFILRNISDKTWQKIIKNGNKTLADRAWQIIGIGGLMQGVNRYETAANTNQPSKLVAALTGTTQAFGFLFSSGWILQAVGFLTAALLYMGEQNDIENSNHPDKRREWDLSRINQSFKNHTFLKESASAAHFIADDFKHAFSADHWRNLKTNGLTRNTFETPQSYQSALGVQFSLVSLGFYTVMNTIAKPLKGISDKALLYSMNITNILGSLIPQFPVFTRALENRDQVDGKLVLTGSPMISAGRFFQMIPAWKFLGGLGFVGDAVKGKGLALNSQKYLALLNQMRAIHTLTQRDPYITATTILNMMSTSPDIMNQLRQQMGQPRLDFFIQLLKKAENEYQLNGTSLNAYLTPLLETNNS